MKNSQSETSKRANQLAENILKGVESLASFAENLTESEWQTPVTGDGRSVGVVIHHVASSYPMEIELAQTLASRNPITGATMAVVNEINANHAKEFGQVKKNDAIKLLHKNGNDAATAVRALTDQELDNAETVSLNADAPLTTQFFIEDHALRHSFHHLAKIKATLNK